ALLLIMITSILMGMGMPCTPAYIVAVTIGGPALQAMGIDVLTAHLFVFYFAILAEITPPVSIASYCGAAIAGSDPLKTGFEAMRMAIVGFIIPYIFVFNPALMLNGSALEVITLIIIVMYAVVTLASAFRGYFHRILKMGERALMGLLAAALIVVSCNLFIMHNMAFQIAILASAALIVLLFVLAKIKLSKGTAIAA
ncbi:MAG: TRAP transporter large permease subunit, partial [Sphaerochaetaceae bacterium]